MSVVVDIVARRRPFGAFDDPRLPTGIWLAAEELVGDGSGGANQIRIVFATATQQRTQEMFSLEQLSVITNETVSRTGRIQTINLDSDMRPPQTTVAKNQTWTYRISTDGVSSAIPAEDQDGVRGLFLGRQVLADTLTGLAIFTVNVTSVTTSVRIQGYVWGPRSVSVPEGPARPLLTIFRP